MNEIICPHCKKAFKIDEAGYAEILSQVRTHEFDQELHERLAVAEKEKESAIKLAEEKTKNELRSSITQVEQQLAELKAGKDAEIAKLQAKLESSETEKRLALSEAVNKLEKERDQIANELQSKESEQKLVEASIKEKYEQELTNPAD